MSEKATAEDDFGVSAVPPVAVDAMQTARWLLELPGALAGLRTPLGRYAARFLARRSPESGAGRAVFPPGASAEDRDGAARRTGVAPLFPLPRPFATWRRPAPRARGALAREAVRQYANAAVAVLNFLAAGEPSRRTPRGVGAVRLPWSAAQRAVLARVVRAGAAALEVAVQVEGALPTSKAASALAAAPALTAVREVAGLASADPYSRGERGSGGARGRTDFPPGREGSSTRRAVRVVGRLGADPARGARGVLPVVASRVALPDRACTLDIAPFIARVDPRAAARFLRPSLIARELSETAARNPARAYSCITTRERRRLLRRMAECGLLVFANERDSSE